VELSGLTRHVPVWYLIILSLVSFQVKLTDTLPDHETPGNPIEATLSGLLCVRHSASYFVSTVSPSCIDSAFLKAEVNPLIN
jgi:hypothetical protein